VCLNHKLKHSPIIRRSPLKIPSPESSTAHSKDGRLVPVFALSLHVARIPKKTMSPSQITQAVESGVESQSPSRRKVRILPRDTLSTPPSHNSKFFLLAHLGTRCHQSACRWTPWHDDTLSLVHQKQPGGRTPIPSTFNNSIQVTSGPSVDLLDSSSQHSSRTS
jgi:hypothetical protein